MNEFFRKYNLSGDRLRVARLLNYAMRAFTRVVTYPAIFLPEGKVKNAIRLFFLNFQNSLPTEFMVNKGDVVVQIGTPWAYTLRRFRRAAGDNGKLIIVEAMPDNSTTLKKTIEEDGYDNVIIFEGAAWSERKSGSFQISPHKGDHRIKNDDIAMDNDLREINTEMEEITVEFYSIDEILAQLGIEQINHLSVTVNGAEHEVLMGAENTIKNSQNLIIYSKAHARDANGIPISRRIIPYLQSLGCHAKLTKGEPSSTTDKSWQYRDGDVFGWKRT